MSAWRVRRAVWAGLWGPAGSRSVCQSWLQRVMAGLLLVGLGGASTGADALQPDEVIGLGRSRPAALEVLVGLPPAARAPLSRMALLEALAETGAEASTASEALEALHQHRVRVLWQERWTESLATGRSALDDGALDTAATALGVAEVAERMVAVHGGEVVPGPRQALQRDWWLAWSLARLAQLSLPLGGALLMGLLVLGWRRRSQPSAQPTNPFITGAPVRDAGGLFGRAALIESLYPRLRAGQSHYLHGERRIGKTSLLLRLAALWQDEGGVAIFVDLEGVAGSEVLTVIRDGIEPELSARGLSGDGPLAERLAQLRSPAGQPVLLAIDEVRALDRVPPADVAELTLCLEVAAVGLLAGVGMDESRWPAVVPLPVPPLAEPDLRALISHGLSRAGLWLGPWGLAAAVAEADGRPMRAQLIGLYLVERGRQGWRPWLGRADLAAVREQAEGSWQRIQEATRPELPPDWELQRAVLELIRLEHFGRLVLLLGCLWGLPGEGRAAPRAAVSGHHLALALDSGRVEIWERGRLTSVAVWQQEHGAGCSDLQFGHAALWCVGPGGLRRLAEDEGWRPRAVLASRQLRRLVRGWDEDWLLLQSDGALLDLAGDSWGHLGAFTETLIPSWDGAWLLAAHPNRQSLSIWRASDGRRLLDLALPIRPVELAFVDPHTLLVGDLAGEVWRLALLSPELPWPLPIGTVPDGDPLWLVDAPTPPPPGTLAVARDLQRPGQAWRFDGQQAHPWHQPVVPLDPLAVEAFHATGQHQFREAAGLWRQQVRETGLSDAQITDALQRLQATLPLSGLRQTHTRLGAEPQDLFFVPPRFPSWLSSEQIRRLVRDPLARSSWQGLQTEARAGHGPHTWWFDLLVLGSCWLVLFLVSRQGARRRRAVLLEAQNPFSAAALSDPRDGPLAQLGLVGDLVRSLPHNRIVLTGPAFSGKRAVLGLIESRLRAEGLAGAPCVPVRVELGGLAGEEELWQRLAAGFAQALAGWPDVAAKLAAATSPRSLVRALRRLGRHSEIPGRVVLIIDGLHEVAAFSQGRQQLRGVLQTIPARQLSLIATATTLGPTGEAGEADDSPWYNHYLVRPMRPLRLDELRRWIQRRMPLGLRVEEEPLRLIHQLSRGEPELARQLLADALADALGLGLTSVGTAQVLAARQALQLRVRRVLARELAGGFDARDLEARIHRLRAQRATGYVPRVRSDPAGR